MRNFIAASFFVVAFCTNCYFALATKAPFRFTRARVLEGIGFDTVTLWTELPSPIPSQTDDPLALYFYANEGQGAAYIAKHFPGLKVEVK